MSPSDYWDYETEHVIINEHLSLLIPRNKKCSH